MPELEFDGKFNQKHLATWCFAIPVFAIAVLTAIGAIHTRSGGTISALATSTSQLAIAFGVAMGLSAVLLPLGAYVALVRAGVRKKAPAVRFFCAVSMAGVVVGCAGLAIMTVRDDKHEHYGFAAVSFVSQWILVAALCSLHGRWIDYVLLLLAAACLLVFAVSCWEYAYWFEYAFLLALAGCALECVHNQPAGDDGGEEVASIQGLGFTF